MYIWYLAIKAKPVRVELRFSYETSDARLIYQRRTIKYARQYIYTTFAIKLFSNATNAYAKSRSDTNQQIQNYHRDMATAQCIRIRAI